MTYPTPGEYQQAVQFPAAAFADPQLQDAAPETSALGLPRATTGAFAVVFPVKAPGVKWAVKCFLTDVPDQRRRYRAIADHLRDAGLPYTARFEYQPAGIHVAGQGFPILKMEWLDGTSLNRFLAANRTPEALDGVIREWRRLIGDLERAGIAHGDLQHGNILVDAHGNDPAPRLRLVDYDTMFVPALAGRKSPEVGHRNYQHPDRDQNDFGPYVDRFSALVIDTALQACRLAPELWDRFDTDENILFRSEDLSDPSSSALFDELRQIEAIRKQVDVLERACFLEPEDVPPLSDVVEGRVSEAHSPAGARRRERRSQVRQPRTPFERGFLPALLVACVLVFIAVSSWTALTLGGAVIAVALGLAAARYRRLPGTRRRRRLRRELAYFDRLIESLRDELRTMEARRETFIGSHEDRVEERLRELQESAMDDRLKHHFVGEARGFEGLTHKVVVRLKAAGIRTASHATPQSVNGIRQLSPESKALVNLWRSTLASRYRDEIPDSLSPAEERRLNRRLEKERAEIDRQITRQKEKLAIQQDERAQIADRLNALNSPTFRHYLAHLLRLKTTRP